MKIRKGKHYLQQYQVDYIKENHKNLTSSQMAGAIGFSQTTVMWWCNKLYVKPTKSYFQFRPPVIPVCEPY